MTERLIALLNGQELGTVDYQSARLSFTYAKAWREADDAYPLSLSLPLGSATHGHARVDAFLWGLLPDNDRVLQAWGKRFKVSPRNAFRLITHVGEDCAGAVQFILPERMEDLAREAGAQDVTWLTREEVAERLRALRSDPSEGRAAGDHGWFSLAGAQPKTALLLEKGRWGVPAGRTPTTHILKPPAGEWDSFAENEHFCLQLARNLGLVVPNSQVERFGEEVAIVVERFDRVHTAHGWTRIHQEDFCQALGIHPALKYESDGGPGVAKIAEVLWDNSTAAEEDVWSFVDAIAFSWLTAGTDAHAKNYALLLGPGTIRLAPFYDLASVLPYDKKVELRKSKLAMKLGGEYKIQSIGRRHLQRLAKDVRVPESALLDRMSAMVDRAPRCIEEVGAACHKEGISAEISQRLSAQMIARVKICGRLLGSVD
jgi:serine/threonine-protein kinase HipA